MRDDVPLGDSQFRTLPTAILLARLRLSRGSVNHKPIPNLAAGEMMFKTSPGHHTDRPLRTRVVTPQGAETGRKTTSHANPLMQGTITQCQASVPYVKPGSPR